MNISDVKKLCQAVLETPPTFWDNPNGAHESTCPFCYVVHKGHTVGMADLKGHDKDCAYILAQKISAELE